MTQSFWDWGYLKGNGAMTLWPWIGAIGYDMQYIGFPWYIRIFLKEMGNVGNHKHILGLPLHRWSKIAWPSNTIIQYGPSLIWPWEPIIPICIDYSQDNTITIHSWVSRYGVQVCTFFTDICYALTVNVKVISRLNMWILRNLVDINEITMTLESKDLNGCPRLY